jgi:putative ABC transport system substrate-binding protein
MQLKRRDVMAVLVAAAMVRPRAARAAQSPPIVGFLHSQSPNDIFAPMAAAFRRGLSESGYVEGHGVAIEYRWAENHLDRLPTLAAELVGRNVAVIATLGGLATALAAKAATTAIPIVFNSGSDPVAAGLVNSLDRPGGNLTGVTFFAVETLEKRVEFMREIMPDSTLAVLINPDGADASAELREIEALVKRGQRLMTLRAVTDAELDTVLTKTANDGVPALIIAGDPLFQARAKTITALAEHNRIALATGSRAYRGQLLSYGIELAESYREVGALVGKVLDGAKPADLPVQRVDKIELVIDLKAAKALGLAIPPPLIARADEVIE